MTQDVYDQIMTFYSEYMQAFEICRPIHLDHGISILLPQSSNYMK